MLTFHHVGVAQCTKALSTKHATHHATQAGVLEHALHVVGGHQTTHQAPHHPGHTPGVARHLLDDLKPRVFPRLGFKKPGEGQNRSKGPPGNLYLQGCQWTFYNRSYFLLLKFECQEYLCKKIKDKGYNHDIIMLQIQSATPLFLQTGLEGFTDILPKITHSPPYFFLAVTVDKWILFGEPALLG